MQLSIVVPIYNVEQYLRECLDSLYKIDGIDYEVILVNDGSKDKSREIMEEFKQSYPERTVIVDKKENGGLSSARNIGMRVAKGEYISFIDSDDFIDVQEYKKFFLEGEMEDLDVMVGNMRYYTPEKTGAPLFRSDLVKNSGVVTGITFGKLFQQPKCFREETVDDIYRREFLIDNNLWFNEDIVHEDSEFTPLVYLKAKRVKYIDRAFYFYRQRTGSIMNKVSEKSIISLEKICEKFFNEYKNLDSKIGKETLAKLILSFYSVVIYKRYNGGGDWKRVHSRYKEIYRELKKVEKGNIETQLLYYSVFVPNFLRRCLGKEISNVQKIPKF